ncbi:hypothetical protein DESA109040_09925 [Deinococcus saxicola]
MSVPAKRLTAVGGQFFIAGRRNTLTYGKVVESRGRQAG